MLVKSGVDVGHFPTIVAITVGVDLPELSGAIELPGYSQVRGERKTTHGEEKNGSPNVHSRAETP